MNKRPSPEFAKDIVYMGHLFHLKNEDGDRAEYVAEDGQDCLPSIVISRNLYGYYEHTGLIERR